MCAWTHTCWNIFKQLLTSKGDTGLPDIFLIRGTQIKDALFIAKTFNSYFTHLEPTLAEENPRFPKSYEAFMPHPTPFSFGQLPTSSLEIIQIIFITKKFYFSWN